MYEVLVSSSVLVTLCSFCVPSSSVWSVGYGVCLGTWCITLVLSVVALLPLPHCTYVCVHAVHFPIPCRPTARDSLVSQSAALGDTEEDIGELPQFSPYPDGKTAG